MWVQVVVHSSMRVAIHFVYYKRITTKNCRTILNQVGMAWRTVGLRMRPGWSSSSFLHFNISPTQNKCQSAQRQRNTKDILSRTIRVSVLFLYTVLLSSRPIHAAVLAGVLKPRLISSVDQAQLRVHQVVQLFRSSLKAMLFYQPSLIWIFLLTHFLPTGGKDSEQGEIHCTLTALLTVAAVIDKYT